MHSRHEWAAHLNSLADSSTTQGSQADAPALVRNFTDERGNRLPIDPLLLAHVLHIDRPLDPLPPPNPQNLHLRLWRHACTQETEPKELPNATPLLDIKDFGSIETWTESFLCALHALGWLSRHRPARYPRDRIDRELAWIIEHVEPDNATRHPWAIHLFLDLALRQENAEAMLYAQELLHVCQVSTGKPALRSAWILRDSANWLGAVESL